MINRVSCQNQKAWSSALFQQERMQKVWNSKEILMKMRTKRASAVTILSFFINERGVTATPPFIFVINACFFVGYLLFLWYNCKSYNIMNTTVQTIY